MKICILTPRFPFPQYGGDALRINEVAKYLKSQGHTLILVSLSDDSQPPVADALTIYDKVYYTKRNHIQTLINCITFFLRRKPMQCGYYYSPRFKQLLQKVVHDESPDLYVSHLLRMVPYLDELGLVNQSIVEMTDALSKTYTLSATAKGVGYLKYVYAFEQKLIQRYEQYVINRFPKVVLVSQSDVDFLRQANPTAADSLHVFTNGVDISPNIPTDYNPNKISFIGNMRSMQNQDAAMFFATKVFPLIKQQKPEAKFYIVGSLPPKHIQDLASNDIIVTGFVDDLEATISDSCLAVAPVRVAAGIQNKVLVAMGCGLPVVLTSLISKAIPELTDGENCIISDEAPTMAQSALRIMTNPQLRQSLALAGYEMVSSNYSWDEKLKGYENL